MHLKKITVVFSIDFGIPLMSKVMKLADTNSQSLKIEKSSFSINRN